MKIEDIVDLIKDIHIIICENNGRVHYTGLPRDIRLFENLEITRLNIVNNQLIITISTNDMLNQAYRRG